MRAAISTLEVVRPKRLDDALGALARAGGRRLTPIAGATDLLVYLNAGADEYGRFLDLLGLRELRGIRVRRDGVTLGALTTFREIRDHAVLRRRFPSLVAAAAEVGAWQIQARATIGGNIANASPAGDSLPVLMAHDAVVHARSSSGPRDIPMASFYRGYRTLELRPDELIVAITLPFAPARAKVFFRKVGTRRAQSIYKVVFSGVLVPGRKGTIADARLAWGSVAPVTMRSRGAEAALVGATPSAATAARARAALASDIAPIDDIRSDREYRLAIAGNVLEQFLRAADARFTRV
jgi:CO/xanthine dehydrogenase FAD-binding subunit